MPSLKTAKPKIFLDSSVLIAAFLSPSGGSFRLLEACHNQALECITNLYVFKEIHEVVKCKYPTKVSDLNGFVVWSKIAIMPDPKEKTSKKFSKLIVDKDIPILAGAYANKAHFLITLDKKDFFSAQLKNADLPFLICTPGDFLQNHNV